MEQFEYIGGRSPRLGREVTPSFWKGEPKYTLITKIKMSCGGGMGGSTWYEYVHRVEEIPSNEIKKFKRYDGKEISINTSFIVNAEDFKLAVADLDVSEWKQSKGESGSWYRRYYVLIDDEAELELVGGWS